jgi:hypothetical protein
MYFRGQGKVYIGTRDTLGNPQAMRWVGNCPNLEIGYETENLEHKESFSGQALTDLKISKGKSSTLAFTLEDFKKENLALALFGTAVAVAGASAITGETLGGTPDITVLGVGQVYKAAKRNGTLVTLKDSTSGTAKTLVKDVNYTIEPNSMTIELIDVTTGGAYTGPLKLDYTPGASTEIGMFNAAETEYFLRFVGMNQADNGKIVTVDLYKVSLNPTKALQLITEELSQLELDGAALIDVLKSSSATLGQFGAIYQQA